MRSSMMSALSAGLIAASGASASIVSFASDPFAGSTALTTAGRQVVAVNELFLPTFDLANGRFEFDPSFFAIGDSIVFANALAANLPTGGVNVIVLQDTDNDNNPATAFNAGAAANVIAARISTPGAGLFVYWNSALNVNRLVYSTNLDDNTADLSVVARIVSPTGADAIASLPLFGASNFAVPAPSAGALLALAGLGMTRRRR